MSEIIGNSTAVKAQLDLNDLLEIYAHRDELRRALRDRIIAIDTLTEVIEHNLPRLALTLLAVQSDLLS
jgi:hypothetical protein